MLSQRIICPSVQSHVALFEHTQARERVCRRVVSTLPFWGHSVSVSLVIAIRPYVTNRPFRGSLFKTALVKLAKHQPAEPAASILATNGKARIESRGRKPISSTRSANRLSIPSACSSTLAFGSSTIVSTPASLRPPESPWLPQHYSLLPTYRPHSQV